MELTGAVSDGWQALSGCSSLASSVVVMLSSLLLEELLTLVGEVSLKMTCLCAVLPCVEDKITCLVLGKKSGSAGIGISSLGNVHPAMGKPGKGQGIETSLGLD